MTDPWELVLAHERSAGDAERQSRGAFYTPRTVVDEITALAIPDGVGSGAIPGTVVDPTCGAGAFLLGALDRLVALGIAPGEALSRVWGIDSDAGAVEAARAALRAWAQSHNHRPHDVEKHVIVGDGLGLAALMDHETFPHGSRRLILGNPPFATPLKGSALPDSANEYRLSNNSMLGPYADLAAIHLSAAVETSRSGDRVVMVLPQSLVSSRDVGGLRSHLAEVAPASEAWGTAKLVFTANVRVWAPILDVGGAAADDRSWAALLADSLGGPVVDLDGEPLRGRVEATAGFRDEYYGLAAACIELDDHQRDADDLEPTRLVTVGSLDPLWSWWGHRPIKFAKRSWSEPVVDPALLDDKVGRWFERQVGPKVLLPTQSRVFEPVVDREGSMVPVTPLISIQIATNAAPLADGDHLTLDMVAAMLLAPPLVAWARRRWFGAALSAAAIKVPASAVAELPMPTDVETWRRAAQLVGSASNDPWDTRERVGDVARIMCSAYEPDAESTQTEALFAWWHDRLPPLPTEV